MEGGVALPGGRTRCREACALVADGGSSGRACAANPWAPALGSAGMAGLVMVAPRVP